MVKKNALIRYRILDTLLSGSYSYTVPDLVNRVNERLREMDMEEVSRRCIEKDLEKLEAEPFGALIKRVWIEGRKIVSYEEKGFTIFTKKLSEDEENLLSEVLNTLGQFDGLDNFEWLDGLKKSLSIKEHRRIIQFDSNPDLVNRNILGALFKHISNKQVLEIKYRSYEYHREFPAIVHPYLLKEYDNRWYLIAARGNDKNLAIRYYAIDRILNFKPCYNVKYQELEEDIEERFEDIVGVTNDMDKKVERVLFWVENDKDFRYVTSKPFHGSQRHNFTGDEEQMLRNKYPQFKGGYFVTLDCKLNYELEQLFFSRMDTIVVLEPEELLVSIKKRISNLNNLYSRLVDVRE